MEPLSSLHPWRSTFLKGPILNKYDTGILNNDMSPDGQGALQKWRNASLSFSLLLAEQKIFAQTFSDGDKTLMVSPKAQTAVTATGVCSVHRGYKVTGFCGLS